MGNISTKQKNNQQGMLLLEKIQLKNFLSHADTTIDFSSNEKLLIDGVSGAGKSSIAEALTWALYNRGRADNRTLIRKGTKIAKVVLCLVDDDIHYKIERSASVDGKHELKVYIKNNTETYKQVEVIGIKQLQDYIEKTIVKSSYLLFINSVVHPQMNDESFVKQTAQKRKEILLEMANTSRFDEYLKKTKELLSDRNNASNSLLGAITVTYSGIDSLKSRISELKSSKSELDTLNAEIRVLEAKAPQNMSCKEALTKAQGALEMYIHDRTKHDKELSTFPAKTSVNLDDLNAMKSEVSDFDAMRIRSVEWRRTQQELFKKYEPMDFGFIESQIKSVNQSLISIIEKKELGQNIWTCPQCGLKTPHNEITHGADTNMEQLNKLLLDLSTERNIRKDNEERYFMAVTALGDEPVVDENKYSILKRRIAEIENFSVHLTKRDELERNLISIQSSILDVRERIKELEVQYDPMLDIEIHKILTKILILEKDATLVTTLEKDLSDRTTELAQEQTKLDVIKKDIEILSLMRDAFSPNGITAMVVDYLVPQLEEKVNKVLSRLSDFRIRFDTQRKGVTEDVTKEGLFITIINEQDEELDYDVYSGGEKVRIMVAISEALSEVQTIGFRILDEAFIGLDEESVEGFVQVIEELQDRFQQLICISHLRNIKDEFDNQLLIIKSNGISRQT